MLNLLHTRRFAPLFWTQLLGAFNDNLLKSALVAALTFGTLARSGLPLDVLVNLVTGLLVLPFFFFSAVAGQIADGVDKARLARALKVAEIGAMGIAAIGFATQSVTVLLVALFAMGTQSAFFGPVKYAILPQHLEESELVGGNALVETGTFVAILAGTLVGTLVLSLGATGLWWVAAMLLAVAVAGAWVARRIPTAPACAVAPLKIRPLRAVAEAHRASRRDPRVLGAILGVSAFWGVGAVVLGQLPRLALERSAGEMGLSPFGAIGVAVGLFLIASADTLLGASLALGLVGASGGLFVVPLYARMQKHARPDERSRVIAANNIANAAFMVGGAAYAALRLGSGTALPSLFVELGVVQLVVAIVALMLNARDVLHLFMRRLVRVMYRLDTRGLDTLPRDGAALVVANHASFVDAFIVGALMDRPMRFVMDYRMARLPGLAWFFRLGGAIPIASGKDDPALLRRAMETVDQALAKGELVMIFPEGKCTRDGEVDVFRRGVERILARRPVPVFPVGIRGLWGSFFSYARGFPMSRLPHRFRARVAIRAGAPLSPDTPSDSLRDAVVALMSDQSSARQRA